MQPLRVAAVTLNGLLGQADTNLNAMERWTAEARAAGAHLVLFPELIVRGHCDPDTRKTAGEVPGGGEAQRICAMAGEHEVFVCAGLAERDGERVFNTQMLAGPRGFVGAQRKIHLSRDEAAHFDAGRAVSVLDIGLARVGIGICYDNWSPEVPRMLALEGAELLLMPHASRMRMWEDTPESERAAAECVQGFFRRVFPARASENACFVVAVNQAGRAGHLECYPKGHPNQPHHAGGCLALDPFGEMLAELPPDGISERMLVVELEAGLLDGARAHPNYTIRTRRPEVYGRLVVS